jgi:hypothetical protein
MKIKSNTGVNADAKVVVEANRTRGKTNTQMSAGSQFNKPTIKQSARTVFYFLQNTAEINSAIDVRTPTQSTRQVIPCAQWENGHLW